MLTIEHQCAVQPCWYGALHDSLHLLNLHVQDTCAMYVWPGPTKRYCLCAHHATVVPPSATSVN
jgi:hypothetical protein